MDANTTWQYAAVILLVVFALWRIIRGMKKKNRSRKSGSCCGCSLADTCRDYSNNKSVNHSGRDNDLKRDCCK